MLDKSEMIFGVRAVIEAIPVSYTHLDVYKRQVVLLCSGFALYSFFRLSAAEGQKDFNLYELVPSTSAAVFVTDDVLEFVAEVDDLTCSKNQQYLYVSKLFSYLKQSLYALSEDTPHGLSRQMNQMLISFCLLYTSRCV